MFTRNIVSEKEKKIREGMFMMGLNETALFWSWLILYFLEYTVFSIVATIIMYIYIYYYYYLFSGPMLKYSEWIYLFLMLFFFGLCVVTFTNMVCSLFTRTKTAVIGVIGVYILFYLPCGFTADQGNSRNLKLSLSVFFPVAFDMGMGTFSVLESDGVV